MFVVVLVLGGGGGCAVAAVSVSPSFASAMGGWVDGGVGVYGCM